MLLYLFCFLISASLLALDQWAKFWTESHMTLEEVRPLLPPVLELHAVHNYGAAWSLFAGARWVLVGVTAAMMLAVALALCLRLVRHPLGVFSAFLILAGGVGNLLDRIFQGYVVDMLRFPFWTSYPTFNVADMCVVSGCVLWLLYILFVNEDRKKQEEAGLEAMEKLSDEASGQSAEERPASGGWEFVSGEDTESSAQSGVQSGEGQDSAWQDTANVLAGNLARTDAAGRREAESPKKRSALVRIEERVWQDSGSVQTSDGAPDRAGDVRTADSTQRDAGQGMNQGGFPLPPVPPVLLSSDQKEEEASPEPPRAIDPAILGSSPWKAMYAEEDEAEAKAEARSADRKEGVWDSAESFFGGTPFRKSDRNGRVWP